MVHNKDSELCSSWLMINLNSKFMNTKCGFKCTKEQKDFDEIHILRKRFGFINKY